MGDMSEWFGDPKASKVPKQQGYNYQPEAWIQKGMTIGADQAPQVFSQSLDFSKRAWETERAARQQHDPRTVEAENAYKGWVNKQMKLGGKLTADQQNEVMRGALATGGDSGIIGTVGQRGLTARDLGQKSWELENYRMGLGKDLALSFPGPDFDYTYLNPASFANVYTQLMQQMTDKNTDIANANLMNQFAANEAVKGKDSFVEGLAKGFLTNATESMGSMAGGAMMGGAAGF